MRNWRVGRAFFRVRTMDDQFPCSIYINKYATESGKSLVCITKDILAPKGTYSHGIVKTFKDKEVFRETMHLMFDTFEHIAYDVNKLKFMPIPEVVQEFANKYKEANEAHQNETCGSTD